MYTPISYSLSRLAQPKKKKLKILTTATHEAYQTMLGGLNHEFHLLMGQGFKTWDFHTKPLPSNHYLLTQPFPPMPNGIEFDLLFAQEPNTLQRFLEIKKQTGLPLLSMKHTMPPPGITPKQFEKLKALRGDRNEVFITEFSKDAWGWDHRHQIIRHGVNTEIFKGWNGLAAPHGISVVNQFASRDVFCGWTEWQSVAAMTPMKLVGENPGLSESAKSTDDLVNQLCSARFFLNTSKWSPIPLSLLEAAACGCPIVTTNHQEIAKFFKNGENCLIANSISEMHTAILQLKQDDELCIRLGKAARETILKHFDYQRFLLEWDEVFLRTWKWGV